MRPAAALLLVLLLAPGAGAAWTQQGGDGARSAAIAALPGLLDVVDTLRIAREGESLAFGAQLPLVAAPEALVGILADAQSECAFVRMEDPPTQPTYGRSFACPHGARVLASDATRGILLACVDGPGGEPVMRAYDATGETQRWTLAPRLAANASVWGCAVPALDPVAGVAHVAFARAGGRNEIVEVDLADGEVLRRATIPDSLFSSNGQGGFVPAAIARAPGGLLVSGTWGANASAVAWLDADLAPVRGLVAGSPDDVHGSRHASVQGARGALVLGEWVIVIDPASEGVTRIPFSLAGPKLAPLAPPASGGGLLLAPGAAGVAAYEIDSEEVAWSWTRLSAAEVCDVIVAGDADAYVLSFVPDADAPLALSRLDLATGQELQRLPVRAGASIAAGGACGGFAARLLPSAEGLLVVTSAGELARVAQAPPEFAPELILSNDYPDAGAIVELRAQRPGAVGFVVAWGDGVVQQGAADDVFSHRYAQPVERVLRVSAVLSDGRTATTEASLHVGKERPAALTLAQRAFSAQWQELTFFVIGLLITGAGAFLAMLLRERRHRRLAAEQRELAQLSALAGRDPTAGLVALETHRAHLIRAHTRHRLDDAQFQLLDAKTVRIMRATRYRMLGAAMNELSPHVRRLLDTALEDGRISEAERDALLASIEHERLTREEKERMAALFREWSVQG